MPFKNSPQKKKIENSQELEKRNREKEKKTPSAANNEAVRLCEHFNTARKYRKKYEAGLS
jgi:hypothetical protein